MPSITCFSPILDPWSIFLGRACLEEDIDFRLFTLPVDKLNIDGDQEDCLKWHKLSNAFLIEETSATNLASMSGECCFVSIRGSYGPSDRLLISNFVSGFSRRVGLIRMASSSLRYQARQLIKEASIPYLRNFSELWTEDTRIPLISAILGMPHRYFGSLPHQRACLLRECWDLLDSSIPAGPRKYLFSYAGSANPSREPIAAIVRARLDSSSGLIRLGSSEHQRDVIWHYDQPGSLRPRPYDSYIRDTESSWFCLCLPGWTGTSNRLIEAILRGSVPVLPEEQVKYTNLPLIDSSNAILVKRGRWLEALNKIADLSDQDCLIMQKNVIELAHSQASLKTLSRSLVDNIIG